MLFQKNVHKKIEQYTVIFCYFFQKLRTWIIEAHFGQKIKNIRKCWNPENIRTFEAQLIFTGSYKK